MATAVPAATFLTYERHDLPRDQEQAFEEGHDADLRPSQNAESRRHAEQPQTGSLHKDIASDLDVEKSHVHNSSENTSEDGSQTHRDLEKGGETNTEETEVEEPQDPNVVDWEGPDDPQNPQNWSNVKKWGNVAILSFLTLLTPLASSMFAPGVPQLIKDFDVTSSALATFVVSVYILGFAAGPLLIAPLSEMYGRYIIYIVCTVGFVAFTVGCALATNINMLIGFRFVAGMLGVGPVTIGGGTIADLMAPEARGRAMAIWAMGPLLGPVIGPVAGGFLSNAKGWRWIFWIISIFSGASVFLIFFGMRETYAPVLLERKTKRLRKETGNEALHSKLDLGVSTKELWKRSFVRPVKLSLFDPICALMSLFMAIIYGILYLLFTTFTFVFEENYGFSESIVGLVYVGLGVGMLVGLFVVGGLSDPVIRRLADKHNGGVLKPEYRLPMLMYSAPFLPAGLFLYGWTAQYNIQWAVPLFGTLLVGVGMIGAFLCINTYLIDAYTRYAASAIAANTILRSILGACFPLFGLQMYAALGLGWGNSLLGFIALALCPIPVVFYYYGERIRTHPRFQVKL